MKPTISQEETMVYLSNAFSLQMQGTFHAATSPISEGEAQKMLVEIQCNKTSSDDEGEHTGTVTSWLTAMSIVGHADVAAILSGILGVTVPVNRVSVALTPDDVLIVGQYIGQRLPEGAITLPEGAKIEWYKVSLFSVSREKERADLLDQCARIEREEFDRRCKIVRICPDEAAEFLAAENVEYCGYPDEDGRNAFSKKHGIGRDTLDLVL